MVSWRDGGLAVASDGGGRSGGWPEARSHSPCHGMVPSAHWIREIPTLAVDGLRPGVGLAVGQFRCVWSVLA